MLISSHLDSQTTTDVKLEMIPGVQTGNGIPHDRCDLRGVAHAHTNRKDDIFMERRLGQIITCKGLVKNQEHTRHKLTQL